MKSWVLLYQILHVWVLKTGFGLGRATTWSMLMLFLFKAVSVPGDKISLPLYETTESWESQLQVEWQPDLSPELNIFSLDYVMQVSLNIFYFRKIIVQLYIICKYKV